MTTATIIWIACIQILIILEIIARRSLQKQYNQILESQNNRITKLEEQLNNK